MKTVIKNRFEACANALVFLITHATRIPGARMPILVAELHAVVEAMSAAAGRQSYGQREWRAAASERLHFANLLREEMRFIALMAKSLDRHGYPGLRYQLRLPRSQSYHALIATAHSFIEVLTPLKAEFIERGFPPDFIAHLATLIEAIDRAAQTKASGLLERMHSTANLMATSSHGLALLSEMHAIILRCFRQNASLLAEWQSARHVRRPNQPRATEPTATTSIEPGSGETSVSLTSDVNSFPTFPSPSSTPV